MTPADWSLLVCIWTTIVIAWTFGYFAGHRDQKAINKERFLMIRKLFATFLFDCLLLTAGK